MPICPDKGCDFKGAEQPLERFIDSHKHQCRRCIDCRIKQQDYQRRSRAGLTSRAKMAIYNTVNSHVKEVLPIGDPPKFVAEWDERMYNAWLKDLISSVIRSTHDPSG